MSPRHWRTPRFTVHQVWTTPQFSISFWQFLSRNTNKKSSSCPIVTFAPESENEKEKKRARAGSSSSSATFHSTCRMLIDFISLASSIHFLSLNSLKKVFLFSPLPRAPYIYILVSLSLYNCYYLYIRKVHGRLWGGINLWITKSSIKSAKNKTNEKKIYIYNKKYKKPGRSSPHRIVQHRKRKELY